MSVLIGQKLVENAKKKNQKLKCDILCDFQTLCMLILRIKIVVVMEREVRGPSPQVAETAS